MRNIWGLLAVGVLALTACSAPVDSAAPAPVTVTSAAATITAAPIAPKVAAKVTDAGPGTIGNPADDERFLAGVKTNWRGTPPSDTELVSAAKYACDEYAAGKMYDEMRPVAGTTDDELSNGITVAVYAGRIYCTKYNPDNL